MFRQYATKLHIELHLVCRIACALPCHAYLNRTCIILDCATCHDFVVVVYYVVCSFPVLLLRVGSDNFVLWGPVRLRPFVFFMDSFYFLAGSQERSPLPSISLLSLLASCFVLSLRCATYHFFTMLPKFAMSASNLFTLPSKPLFGYVTAFAQPLL